MLFDLTGEVAVVVGGTGVLGGAIAEGLARAGAAVAILGRDRERGESRAHRIREAGGSALYVSCDATLRSSVAVAHHELTSRLGPPTVLVNAAGGNLPQATISGSTTIDSLSSEAWEEAFRLNVIGGALVPCQEFGAGMLERGKGSVINIASVSAHVPLSRVIAYSAAKAAVLNFTQFLAREWATAGVRVNSITPGFFPAEQNRRLLLDAEGHPTERGQQILSHTPMRRFGDADELIGAAIYLAAPRASSFVTGSDLRVDGGFLAQTI